jgi:hypothetical protein
VRFFVRGGGGVVLDVGAIFGGEETFYIGCGVSPFKKRDLLGYYITADGRDDGVDP